MSINLSDELHAATTKGKLASAKEVYLDGDKENLQQVGEKTHQLEEAVKDISVTGGASTANTVSYDNKTSGMTSVTAQGAIDELAAKDKSQDSIIDTKANKTDVQQSVSELKSKDTAQDNEIAKKADASDVDSKMQGEQTRVNAELDKKFDKENIAQELGNSKDKVASQVSVTESINDCKIQSIFKIHVEWNNGDDNIKIPVLYKLRAGEEITITVSNVIFSTLKESLSIYAVALYDGTDYIKGTIINNSEGTITYKADEDICIKSIVVNINNDSVAKISFDVYVESGEFIKRFKELQKDSTQNKTELKEVIEQLESVQDLVAGKSFRVSKEDTYKRIYNNFKAGDVIKTAVSNFSYEGEGSVSIYLKANAKFVYTLNNLPNRISDYTTYIILPEDCSYIEVGCSISDTIEVINADFAILYDQSITALHLKREAQRDSGYWHKSFNYNGFVQDRSFNIVYPFKAKELLVLAVSNIITDSKNINISVYIDNTNVITQQYNGYASYIIEKDTENISILMYQSDSNNDFTCDVELMYGAEAEAFIKKQNILPLLKAENKTFFKQGTLSNFVYYKKAYVGYNNPFDEDCLVKSLKISSYDSSNKNIGKSYNFVIGTIDQRNWLLPRITFTSQIKQVNNSIIMFDFSDEGIMARKGEVIFIEMTPTSEKRDDVLCGLSIEAYDVDNKFMVTSDINTELNEVSSAGCLYYELQTIVPKTILAQKNEITSLQSQIDSLQNRLNTSNIFEDRLTGIRYQITVNNGKIVLQSLNISKMLVIGHSFVIYNNSPKVDWYLEDDENRAMSASINKHQWTSLIKDKLELSTLKLVSGVDFERNYSIDYDFNTKWGVTDDYDVICVYLAENAVYAANLQESWEAMLNYLKTAAPKAKILCTGSWRNTEVQQAIQAACKNTIGVTYVNMLPIYTKVVNNSIQWYKGDYYYGREGSYYPIGASYSHPNDKGMLDIANVFLSYMGMEQINDKTHTITLNQTSGGILETPNVEWLEDGIVTIRCIPDNGHTIDSISVVKTSGNIIVPEKRTNNYYDNTERIYYTFVMPKEDVVVTPTWL